MTSVVKNIRLDNDSVVYEHIIPRTARQKWIRRASFDFSSTETFPVSVQSPECTLDKHFVDSIVSHDVQDEVKEPSDNDLGHISVEEEVAVFNAWGVKLRHVNRRKESLKTALEVQKNYPAQANDSDVVIKKDCKQNSANCNSIQSQSPSKVICQPKLMKNKSENHTILPKSFEKLKESSLKIKRERPKSMPVITPETLKHSKQVPEDDSQQRAPPKAYKSPHSKVPWTRPGITNNLHSRDNKAGKREIRNDLVNESNKKATEEVLNKTDESISFHTVSTKAKDHKKVSERTDLVTDSSKENIIRDVSSSVSESMQGSNQNQNNKPISVIKRRQSFEVFEVEGHQNAKNSGVHHVRKTVNGSINGENKKQAPLMQTSSDNKRPDSGLRSTFHLSDAKKDLSDNTGRTNNVCQKDKDGISIERNYAQVKGQLVKPSSSPIKSEDMFFKSSHGSNAGRINIDDAAKQGNIFSKDVKTNENNRRKLSDIFQTEPSITSADTNNISEISKQALNNDLIQNDGIPVTTTRAQKRRVGKLTIQSGDRRERQSKLKQDKNFANSNVNNGSVKETSKNPSGAVQDKDKAALSQKSEIIRKVDVPITNIDDFEITEKPEKVNIPVTNLDELSTVPEVTKDKLHPESKVATKVDSTMQKSGKQPQAQSLGKNHFCPIKKVDYNDARLLITPKVIFEKPVGLTSAMSPKGKKQSKKRQRVCFSTEELEKLHLYPSEAAASEMYDEGDQSDGITNIDSVLNIGYSCDNLASYTPSGLSNLQGTLERERKNISSRSNDSSTKDLKEESITDAGSAFRGEGDHFTQSADSTASAMLF